MWILVIRHKISMVLDWIFVILVILGGILMILILGMILVILVILPRSFLISF